MKNKDDIINEALSLIIDANEKGVTNYRIAKETGISEKTIGNYTNGKTKPTYPNALVLLEYFGRETPKMNKSSVIEKEGSVPYFMYKELQEENKRLQKQVGYYEGLLDKNGINYSKTAM